MKKKIAVLLSGLMFFSITGCSFSNFGGTTKTDEAVVVPKDSLVAIEGQEIVFDNGKIQIPEGYTIGSGNFTNPTDNTPFSLVGIWKTTEEEATTEISTDESEEVQKKVEKLMNQYDKEKIDGATYAEKMMKLAHSIQKKKK